MRESPVGHRAVAGATNDLRRTPQGVEVWNQLNLGTDAVLVVANLDPLTRECGRLEDCLNDRIAVMRRLQDEYGGARDLRLWNASDVRVRRLVGS